MAITTVLFDLDGTLLPMDQVAFVKTYLHLLARNLAPYGYDPKALTDAVWVGTGAMMKNTSGKTNEEVYSGRTEDGKIVFFEGEECDKGNFVMINIERAEAFALYGQKQK